jgi:hypothetical protein
VQSLELVRSNYGYGNNGYGNNGYQNRAMNGTIVSIDRRANLLTMQTDRGRTITVEFNDYAGRGSMRGWRRGDRISVTGQFNGGGNVIATDIRHY